MDSILKLYDTFLGHFQFFRQFIKLFIDMRQRIDTLKTIMSDFDETLHRLEKDLEEFKVTLNELDEKVKAQENPNGKETATNFTKNNPSEIMDRIYNSYNEGSDKK